MNNFLSSMFLYFFAMKVLFHDRVPLRGTSGKMEFAQVVRDTMLKEKGVSVYTILQLEYINNSRVIFSLFIINLFQKEIFLSRSRNTSGDGKNNHKTKNKWMMAIKHLKNKQVRTGLQYLLMVNIFQFLDGEC